MVQVRPWIPTPECSHRAPLMGLLVSKEPVRTICGVCAKERITPTVASQDLNEQFRRQEPDVAKVMPRYQWDERTQVEKDVVRRAVKLAKGERQRRTRHAR